MRMSVGRACREELARRSAESAAVSQRMQTLQREETELFNRAAERRGVMLEMVRESEAPRRRRAAQRADPSVSAGAASWSVRDAAAAGEDDGHGPVSGAVGPLRSSTSSPPPETMLHPRQPMTSMNDSPAMVSMALVGVRRRHAVVRRAGTALAPSRP